MTGTSTSGMGSTTPDIHDRFKASVHFHHQEHRPRQQRGSMEFRRFRGPKADEFFLLARPGDVGPDVGAQARSVYEALLDGLCAQDIDPAFLASETLFLGTGRANLEAVADSRRRVFGQTDNVACRPATTWIGQAPLDGKGDLAVSAVAVVPHRRDRWSVDDVTLPASCNCVDCSAGPRARVARDGDETSFHAGDLRGRGVDAYQQTLDLFRTADALLAEAGMSFRDVVRTWIYLRDIDRDYDALNRGRRDFFQAAGVERRPASTGVQGSPSAAAHDVSMSLYAVRSGRSLSITQMSTPTLNEAWTYGADFSRGLRLVDANKVALYVSGTASLDERGESVHLGDFEAQVERMLLNLTSLLAEQGAGFGDVVSAVTYLKNPSDAPRLHELLQQGVFGGFPLVVVEAPLCRPELLCETEAVALLALPPGV